MSSRPRRQKAWPLAAKRLSDRVVAGVLLVGLSPILGATAIAIRLRMGRPILFIQRRLGRRGEPFRIIKFRTMQELTDSEGRLLPDKDRITPLGNFVRASSLDELPELINVIRGEMSLVGPRPLLPEYAAVYTTEQNRRHEVLPGITGWAQINGRNALTWESRLQLDLWYVDNWSLALDARILLRTLLQVVRREGDLFTGHATSPRLDDTVRSKEETVP